MLGPVKRSWIIAASVLAAAALSCGSTIRAPRTRLTPKQIIERSKPSIVRVMIMGADGNPGLGTGFVVADDGRIATNLHVIQDAVQASVVTMDGTTYSVEQVVVVDETRDLAIVRVALPKTPALRFGDSDKVAAGDPVYAIGNPLGADYTISDGLISAVRSLDESLTVLQISAPISQGSSGGPLLNQFGEVIGVATFLTAGQNLNFGIPSNYLQPMLNQGGGMAFAEFVRSNAARAKKGDSDAGSGARPKIQRRVPQHEVSYLDGCTDENLRFVAEEIAGAIEKGAPIYNDGDHETCFRIYEGTALRLENDLPVECKGPREGLGQGLLRSGTLDSYTEKAWAMRDAFDGLLNVIVLRLRQ